MNRMKAISPGPFDTNKSMDNQGHKKTSTAGSMEDFIRSPHRHSPRPSGGSSGHSRNDSQSSTASNLGRRRSMERQQASTTSTNLAGHGRQESADPCSRDLSSGALAKQPPIPSLKQIARSQTSPIESGRPGGFESISERTQEKPSKHRPNPSVAAAIRPLDEIGSMSSFKPSRSLRGRKSPAVTDNTEPTPSHQAGVGADKRYQDAPPLPKFSRALDFGIGNPYHLSTESNSSNDSAGSEVHTSSSRSSPPLTESPQRTKRKADTSRLDNLMNDFQFDLDENPPPPEEPAPSRPSNHQSSFSRPLYNAQAEPASPAPRQDPYRPPIQAPTPLLPQHQRQEYRRPSDDDYAPSYHLQSGSLRPSPAPVSSQSYPPPPTRAAKPRPNKGYCRGCGELITGKSVSSADGRLTGRYHKACFVCQTCKAPFQTSDFYVIDNQPYCNRHYHRLNGSLCKSCDRGIEGQYLETEKREKFHAWCFSCSVML